MKIFLIPVMFTESRYDYIITRLRLRFDSYCHIAEPSYGVTFSVGEQPHLGFEKGGERTRCDCDWLRVERAYTLKTQADSADADESEIHS